VCFSLKNSDRTLDRTRSRVDLRVRSAQVEGRGAAHLGFVTGHWSGLTSVSEGPWDRSVRLTLTCAAWWHDVIRHGGASGHVRSEALWTPIGRRVQRVQSNGEARPVMATALSDARCHCLSCSDWTRPVTLTGASGHHVFHCVVR
jgi:hypothetical protein